MVELEGQTNLPATMISCASPSSILSSAPLGFAPLYGFNKADMMSGEDVPLYTIVSQNILGVRTSLYLR